MFWHLQWVQNVKFDRTPIFNFVYGVLNESRAPSRHFSNLKLSWCKLCCCTHLCCLHLQALSCIYDHKFSIAFWKIILFDLHDWVEGVSGPSPHWPSRPGPLGPIIAMSSMTGSYITSFPILSTISPHIFFIKNNLGSCFWGEISVHFREFLGDSVVMFIGSFFTH